jgi:hypothetical protein
MATNDPAPLISAVKIWVRETFELVADPKVMEGSLRQRVVWLLLLHQVQLGRAALLLCEGGYPREARPILRSMLSACLSMILMADDGTDDFAVLFLHHELRLKAKIGQALVKHEGLTAKDQKEGQRQAEQTWLHEDDDATNLTWWLKERSTDTGESNLQITVKRRTSRKESRT